MQIHIYKYVFLYFMNNLIEISPEIFQWNNESYREMVWSDLLMNSVTYYLFLRGKYAKIFFCYAYHELNVNHMASITTDGPKEPAKEEHI